MHGTHQVAQKFNTTTLPLKPLVSRAPPSRVFTAGTTRPPSGAGAEASGTGVPGADDRARDVPPAAVTVGPAAMPLFKNATNSAGFLVTRSNVAITFSSRSRIA